MVETAKQFIDANTWVLAAVSNGDREEVVELSDQLAKLFKSE